MKIIIIVILIVLMYTIGYLTGYKECEIMTKKVINQIIEECEEKKVHKIKNPNTFNE